MSSDTPDNPSGLPVSSWTSWPRSMTQPDVAVGLDDLTFEIEILARCERLDGSDHARPVGGVDAVAQVVVCEVGRRRAPKVSLADGGGGHRTVREIDIPMTQPAGIECEAQPRSLARAPARRFLQP